MSLKNIKTNSQGFTIVELLIVIVVIAILAAITIVSYNGITNRANTSAAAAAASTVQKKAEVYAADGPTKKYPVALTDLTSAASSTSYFMSGVSTTAPNVLPDATNGTNTIRFLKCGSGNPTTQTAITSSNITGLMLTYWNFTTSAAVTINMGTVSGGTTACPTVV